MRPPRASRPPAFRALAAALCACVAAPVPRLHAGSGLEEDLFFMELPPVITASLRAMSVAQAPATVYVLTANEIELSGAHNLWDALRLVPGVDVITTLTGSGEVSIRGLEAPGSRYVLVLLDGRTLLGAADTLAWETVPVNVEEIDRIEVVEGASSALYGANATNGVINIITKTPLQLRGGQLSYTGGERKTHQGTFLYGNQSGKLSYKASVGWRSANAFERASARATEAAKFHALLDYGLGERSNVALSFGGTNFDTRQHLYALATEDGQSHFVRADYALRGFKARAYWNRHRSSFRDIGFVSSVNLPGGHLDFDLLDVQAQQSVDFGDVNSLVFGASYRRNTVQSDSFTPGVHAQDLWALFLEDTWIVAPSWTVAGSARLDHHPFTGESFSPRGSVIFNPGDGPHTFRATTGTSFRYPTLTNNYFDYTFPAGPETDPILLFLGFTDRAYRVVGTTEADTEKTTFQELSYRGDFKRVKATLTGFRYVLKDFIAGTAPVFEDPFDPGAPPTMTATQTYTNSGRVTVTGGEAGGLFSLVPGLEAFANYSYQSFDHDRVEFTEEESPRHKANAGARWYSEGLSAGVWVNWVGRRAWPTDPGVDNTPHVEPSYAQLNVHLGYRFRKTLPGLMVALNGFNLANDRHVEFFPGAEAVKPRVTGTVSYHF